MHRMHALRAIRVDSLCILEIQRSWRALGGAVKSHVWLSHAKTLRTRCWIELVPLENWRISNVYCRAILIIHSSLAYHHTIMHIHTAFSVCNERHPQIELIGRKSCIERVCSTHFVNSSSYLEDLFGIVKNHLRHRSETAVGSIIYHCFTGCDFASSPAPPPPPPGHPPSFPTNWLRSFSECVSEQNSPQVIIRDRATHSWCSICVHRSSDHARFRECARHCRCPYHFHALPLLLQVRSKWLLDVFHLTKWFWLLKSNKFDLALFKKSALLQPLDYVNKRLLCNVLSTTDGKVLFNGFFVHSLIPFSCRCHLKTEEIFYYADRYS